MNKVDLSDRNGQNRDFETDSSIPQKSVSLFRMEISLPGLSLKSVGRIELIIGPMFAGKTTELIRRIERCERQRRSCLIIDYADQRGTTNICSHDSICKPAVSGPSVMRNFRKCMAYEVIGIDQAQFFSDIVQAAQLLANSGKTVIIAGLDGTFQRRPFGEFLHLISCCESITKLSAICRETGTEAPFTLRMVNSTDIKLIGGAESYSAASRSIFFGNKGAGQIQMVIGPVKSGKTTELIRLVKRYLIAGLRAVMITKRAEADLIAGLITIQIGDELPGVQSLIDFDVIGVDNGEEFVGIADWADSLANRDKQVIIAALDGNAEQHVIGEVVELIPRCEGLSKLQSVCPLTGLSAPISAMVGVNALPISRLALLSGMARTALASEWRDNVTFPKDLRFGGH
jgi:thymidine kinase